MNIALVAQDLPCRPKDDIQQSSLSGLPRRGYLADHETWGLESQMFKILARRREPLGAQCRERLTEIVQLSVDMIRWGVVLRTEAVVPEYLKRYSMQVNVPVQRVVV